MDADATLEELIKIARRVDLGSSRMGATRLAELVLALDEWLRNGGDMPNRWRFKGGE